MFCWSRGWRKSRAVTRRRGASSRGASAGEDGTASLTAARTEEDLATRDEREERRARAGAAGAREGSVGARENIAVGARAATAGGARHVVRCPGRQISAAKVTWTARRLAEEARRPPSRSADRPTCFRLAIFRDVRARPRPYSRARLLTPAFGTPPSRAFARPSFYARVFAAFSSLSHLTPARSSPPDASRHFIVASSASLRKDDNSPR